jgi:DNA-binding CsgD family transcriptional regulator
MELDFAALHQFCLPLLDRMKDLPPPRRAALEIVFRLRDGARPEAFAERARRELLATGETVRKRAAVRAPGVELTAQERQIALLVRDGYSNPEVGERLYLSPRTVEWHLRKVFAKLGIDSRRKLRDVLPA